MISTLNLLVFVRAYRSWCDVTRGFVGIPLRISRLGKQKDSSGDCTSPMITRAAFCRSGD